MKPEAWNLRMLSPHLGWGARKRRISNYSADPIELIALVHAGIVVCAVTAARVNKDVALSMKALNRKGSVRKEVRTFRCAPAFCGFPSPEHASAQQ